MERQLFEWENWDEVDVAFLQFYQCKLIVDIGPYKKGDMLSCIAINYQDGVLEVYSDDGEAIYRQKLILSLGETVKI